MFTGWVSGAAGGTMTGTGLTGMAWAGAAVVAGKSFTTVAGVPVLSLI
jgi:hypothetical protein